MAGFCKKSEMADGGRTNGLWHGDHVYTPRTASLDGEPVAPVYSPISYRIQPGLDIVALFSH